MINIKTMTENKAQAQRSKAQYGRQFKYLKQAFKREGPATEHLLITFRANALMMKHVQSFNPSAQEGAGGLF